jgi:hypothetical protein
VPSIGQHARGWGRRKPAPAYKADPSDPINLGLQAFWVFNEGGGGVYRDSAGLDWDLTSGDSPPLWTVGPFGPCALYSNAAASTTKLAPTNWNQLSVAFWVNLTASGLFPIVLEYNTSGANFPQLFFSGSSGIFEVFATNNVGILVDGPSATGKGWTFFAVTLDTVNASHMLYRAFPGETPSVVSTSNFASLHIADPTTFSIATGFTGSLDLYRIWNRPIRPGEVSRLFRQPLAGLRTGAPRRLNLSAPPPFGYCKLRVARASLPAGYPDSN